MDQFLFLGNRARFGSFKHEVFFELDLPLASSIFLFQVRHPFRARVTSAFPQSSSVPIYPARCKSSSVSFSRTRVQIELESDVIELGELGLQIFRGGEGGNTIQVHFASDKLDKSLFSFTPSRTSEITVQSQLFLPIFAHILSYHLA